MNIRNVEKARPVSITGERMGKISEIKPKLMQPRNVPVLNKLKISRAEFLEKLI